MRTAALALLVALVVSPACSRGPLQVSGLQTGKSLNSDGSVGIHGTRFAPTDTLYVSVLTRGAGKGTIEARWTFRGTEVSRGTKRVSYIGDAATEFHLQYAGRLPAGDYTVEIFVDGAPVEARTLKVQ